MTRLSSPEDDNLLPVKRQIFFGDRERAESSIQSDYLGASPRFSLDDFERMFRLSTFILWEVGTPSKKYA
jgi:hypothetical protein